MCVLLSLTPWHRLRTEAIEALELWIESARADSEPVPAPASSLAYVRIAG